MRFGPKNSKNKIYDLIEDLVHIDWFLHALSIVAGGIALVIYITIQTGDFRVLIGGGSALILVVFGLFALIK